MAAPGSLVKQFCEEATCPVCLEYFTDPVITECGHNFCRACLTQSCGEPGRSSCCCPECREPVQQNNLRPNRKLANIAEISKKSGLQVAKGTEGAGGACERHQEPLNLFCKDDKAPICVVCQKSKEHRDHQVIPLEKAPVEYKTTDGSGEVCETHQKPLKLFCRDDEAPFCVECDQSQQHRNHHMIPVEEAAEEYQEKIQAMLQSLEKKREKMVKQKVVEEQRNQECLKQLKEELQEVASFFKEIHRFLEEKERFWLKALSDLEKEMKKSQEKNITRLSKEILQFSELIKNVEWKCQQPPSTFLQDIGETLKRCLERQTRHQLELSSGLEWRFKKDFLKTSVLKEVMEEFEGSLKGGLSQESVTLDPNTAHRHLDVSADEKSVTWRGSCPKLPDNPERFSSTSCVLGHERFTSGKHCWEVLVESPLWARNAEHWAVGVARDTVQRKERICLSPDKGIWAVGKDSSDPHAVWAYTPPVNTLLTSGSRDLRKIRVFLDYEDGRVEFVDADTGNWVFSFPPASFSGEEIRPFFRVSAAAARLKC
ncbi:E3 ubiquitin-protein ligase TRIM7-like [Tiliqua scincoides]|uniref:E3 ubiquitin-protein ligase TRIM7-like n=1 Tax=Tiliqua scincoides TaxID=71010 RepID=UPI0034625BEF